MWFQFVLFAVSISFPPQSPMRNLDVCACENQRHSPRLAVTCVTTPAPYRRTTEEQGAFHISPHCKLLILVDGKAQGGECYAAGRVNLPDWIDLLAQKDGKKV